MAGIDLPDWATDGVYCNTTVHLDWKDRLRILFRGEMEVRTRTLTEHKVGRTETDRCDLTVKPIRPRKSSGMLGVSVWVPEEG